MPACPPRPQGSGRPRPRLCRKSLRLLGCVAHAAVVAETVHALAGGAVAETDAGLAHFQEILTGPVHAAAVSTGLIGGVAAGARVPRRSASLAIANQSCGAVRVPVAESASWGEGTADATGAGHARLTIRSAEAVAPGRRRADAGSKFGVGAVRQVAIAMQALGARGFGSGARTTLGTGTLTGTCSRAHGVAPQVEGANWGVVGEAIQQSAAGFPFKPAGLTCVVGLIAPDVALTRIGTEAGERVVRVCREIAGRPQGRPAGRGSRGRGRERVRGRFAGR